MAEKIRAPLDTRMLDGGIACATLTGLVDDTLLMRALAEMAALGPKEHPNRLWDIRGARFDQDSDMLRELGRGFAHRREITPLRVAHVVDDPFQAIFAKIAAAEFPNIETCMFADVESAKAWLQSEIGPSRGWLGPNSSFEVRNGYLAISVGGEVDFETAMNLIVFAASTRWEPYDRRLWDFTKTVRFRLEPYHMVDIGAVLEAVGTRSKRVARVAPAVDIETSLRELDAFESEGLEHRNFATVAEAEAWLLGSD